MSAGRRRTRTNGGYTLIEVCAVLFIILIIGGLTLPAGYSILRQEALLREVRDVEAVARLARRYAMQSQRAEIVTFTQTGWQIQSAPVSWNAANTNSPEVRPDPERIHITPGNITCSISPENDNKWIEAKGFQWIFWPDGTTSPLRIQIARDTSWIQLSFNPMTAFATEEASYMD